MYSINQIVTVTGFYFRGREGRAYPSRIEIGDTQYCFNDGLQYLVKKGHAMVRLFDMTDGRHVYRIKEENDQWSLLWMKPQRA